MSARLIIIRGNSASGKTTTAQQLQLALQPAQTLLISQDVVRRDMLHAPDHTGNLALELIRDLAAFGQRHCQYVILEGILKSSVYREMLLDISATFPRPALVYYFDLPFSVTVQRHELRPNATAFGRRELAAWWQNHDQLGTPNETIFTQDQTLTQRVQQIQFDLSH
ncbi:AAA family ATPase [Lapidilactobacillus luobeiensis]|uniref:AAA family ATPase n=1 Tax=Lapidilactobacillus luobeiensis TaxID=2950371 RepID=UPI0021C49254|nr:AAA family ATPase [Lapidilactobacillus luobeiensis]